MFTFLKKRKNNSVDFKVTIESSLTEDDIKRIEERENETKVWKANNEKYFEYTKESLEISEEIYNTNLYSKAINQETIFNKYADRYTELCKRLLELLPYNIEHDKENAKIQKEEFNIRACGKNIVNFFRLLEKQQKYEEIIKICNYLLNLGITEDGTKNGVKGRLDKARQNLSTTKSTKN